MLTDTEILDMRHRAENIPIDKELPLDVVVIRELCGYALVGLYAIENGSLKDIYTGKVKTVMDDVLGPTWDTACEYEWRDGIVEQVIVKMENGNERH